MSMVTLSTPAMAMATGRSVSQHRRQSTSPARRGWGEYWVGMISMALMSTSLSVQSAWRTGMLASGMPMRLPAMSAGSLTGLAGSEAMTKGFFCIATQRILKGAPCSTAAAV
jgi:hypothetical protein